MELRHLRYFVVVAEELHFGRAATRLHIVQSALSKQIADLEREVAVELLYRNKREVRLTVAGEAFLSEVRQVLDKAEGALQTARRTAAGQIGRLAGGFVGAATYSMIPEILDHAGNVSRRLSLPFTSAPAPSRSRCYTMTPYR